MGKKSAPPAPDYRAAAEQTATGNQEAQTRADWANRPDQTDMYGNKTSWTSSAQTDPATGKPMTKWSQSTQLSPQQQAAINQQQNVQGGLLDTAGGMLGRVQGSVKDPFTTEGMQGWSQGPQAGNLQVDDNGRQRIETALFDRMRPEHAQATAGLEGKLANMGLTRGSEAWNREMQRMGDQQGRERFNAMSMGGEEQQRMFNMQRAAQGQNFDQGMMSANYGNTMRQNQLQEGLALRNQPLNEMNAFMTGQQVQQPSFQGFNPSRSSGGADYMGAAQSQYGSQMDAYNAKQQQRQGLMSGLGSLASAGIMTYSDVRLKSNIIKVGTHPRGLNVYEYDIFGRRERGVLAQELLGVAPHLVSVDKDSGYFMVDYGRL